MANDKMKKGSKTVDPIKYWTCKGICIYVATLLYCLSTRVEM
ncbi:hypothetical protein [Clostridium tagluense]|nr:hypothetical protein [Clostridium tagluense]